MKLNRRYFRSIKDNLSFYVAATILTVTTLCLYFIMNMAGVSIAEFGEDFYESQHVEDANFSTYMPISSEDVSELEAKFNVELETQLYIHLEHEGTTARVFKRPKSIDLYQVTAGEDESSRNDVVISEGYAVENKVKIGDTLYLGDKEYTVTGFMLRPDYLYMLRNESDAYKNVTTFFLAYVVDEEFDSLGVANENYLVRYNEDNETEFRKYVNEKYFMREYHASDENMRIYMVDMQADLFVLMSYIILAVMPLFAVVLVSITISRKVKSEQKMIGTLSALGYRKGQLMCHYAGFAMIPGILGGVIGIIVSTVFAQPFGELGLADYEPLKIKCHMNPVFAIIGIIVPTVMYVIAALVSVRKLLKKDIVQMLNASAAQGSGKLKKLLVGKKVSFRIKYAVRSLIGNPGRSFVVLLGIFMGSYIVLLGFSFLDGMNYTGKHMAKEMGSYDRQYVLDELLTDNPYGGQGIVMTQVENSEGKLYSIIGTTDDNPYLDLKDVDGNDISLKDGYYITSVIAELKGVEVGDDFTIYNPLTMEEHTFTVDGIVNNDMQSAIYIDETKACQIMGLDQVVYNVILSDKELDIPEDMILETISSKDSEEQFNNMTGQMDLMVWLVIILGGVICIASVYVAVNMLVTESRGNISMLKVLGYDNRRINKIVFRVNHILLPIGILLSIPFVFLTVDFFFRYLAEWIGTLVKSYIAPQSYFYAAAFTTLSYFVSLFLVRRKVAKVDMVESLKDNRE